MVCISPAYLAALRHKERSAAAQAQLAALLASLANLTPGQIAHSVPPGTSQTNQAVILCVQVAGFLPHELSIQLRADRLILRGAHFSRRRAPDRSAPAAHFEQTIQLPFAPDPAKVRAQIKNGQLELFLSPVGRAQQRSERISLN